jgi:hypothetical protein
MARLNIEPNIEFGDELYQALLDAHRDLTLEQSHAVNARLILLLANHIGDLAVLREALQRARSAGDDAHADACSSSSISPSNEGVNR